MKKLIFISLIFICFSSLSQVKDTIQANKYKITNLANKTNIKPIDVITISTHKSGTTVTEVDTVIYYNGSSYIKPIGKITYLAMNRGDTIPTFIVPDDSTIIGAYGSGSNPIIQTLIWDTISYPNAVLQNMSVQSYNYLNTYHVSNSGNDLWSGTSQDSAWATIDKVNKSEFNPGDRILFNRGDVWRESLIPPSSGAENNPIIFGAYGSGAKPLFFGLDTIDGWTFIETIQDTLNIYYATNTQFNLYGYRTMFEDTIQGELVASYASFNDNYQFFTETHNDTLFVCITSAVDTSAILVASPTTHSSGLILVNGKSYITLDNLYVKYARYHNIGVSGASLYVTISNCTVDGSGSQGIDIRNASNNFTFSNDTILNSGNDGVYFYYVDYGSLYDCYFGNNGILDIGDAQELGLWASSNIDIYDNEIYHLNGLGSTFEMSAPLGDWLNDSIKIFNNKIEVNSNASYSLQFFSGRYSVHNNLIIGSSATNTAIYIGEAKADLAGDIGIKGLVDIYNNTISGIAYGIKIYQSSDYITTGESVFNVKNNIFHSIGTAYIENVSSGIDSLYQYVNFNNNLYSDDTGTKFKWTGGTTYNFANWKTNSGQDANSPTPADPLFVGSGDNPFSLQAGSPAINNGTDVGLTTDILGNPVPSGVGYDIGAIERQE